MAMPTDSQQSGTERPATAARVAFTIGRRVLLALLRPYRAALILLLVLMLLQSLVSLVNPLLAGKFGQALLQQAPIAGLLLLWFGVLVVQALLGYLVVVRSRVVAVSLSADAGVRMFDHLQALPLRWHQERRHGDVLSLLLRDVDVLTGFVIDTLVPLLPLLLTCLGALVMMLRIEPWFALAAAILIPAVAIAMRWSGRRLRPLGRAAIDAEVERSVAAERSLSLLPLVKAFTGEALESKRFTQRSWRSRDLRIRLTRANALISPLVRVVSAGAILGLLGLASLELASGRLDAEGLISLLLYGLLLTQPVTALAGVWGAAHTAHATAQRLAAVLAASPEPDGGRYVPERTRGEVVFEQVHFAYPGRAPVLRGLDLHLAPGEVVAITGANGAGKSTLMHLLLRFIEPQRGRILLDGRALADFDLRALRRRIGLVPQKVLLFNGSIGANIAYGRPEASAEEIERAARLAQAHDFITRLADGYATGIGDDGVQLSGGQRQRLALARALLKDPAVLIFDEATAMFDPAAEQAFVDAYRDQLRGRSLLLITHRPASLALADRILRLEDGRLHPLAVNRLE